MSIPGIAELPLCDGGGEIMLDKPPDLLWVVVRVERGIPVMAEVYARESSALATEREWREDLKLNNDETGVFATRVSYGPPEVASAKSCVQQVE